ncbi:hypothetical protein EQV77_00960 [Halobacillus fulvus]|nr:hypothetical protein EQV77_00960 [Halobacillus fulvus]
MKWKNKGLWVALGALAVMLGNDIWSIAPAVTEPYVDLGLTILSAAGVISNPSHGKGFKDKEEK